MATRKLKFKPKPIVTGSARRARDKDELPEPVKEPNTLDESTVDVEKPTDSVTDDLASKANSVLVHNSEHLAIANKTVTIGSDIVTPNELRIIHGGGELSDNIVDSNKLLDIQSSNVYNSSSSLDSNKFLSESLINATNNKSQSQVDQVELEAPCAKVTESLSECTLVVGGEKNLQIDCGVTTKTNAPDSGKAFPRFGRTRCKPVLKSSGLRKKNDAVEESAPVKIPSPVLVRTDSVIKSVKAELSKAISVADEIVESFSLLESNEPEPTIFGGRVSEKQQIVNPKGNLRNKLDIPSCVAEKNSSHSENNVTKGTGVKNCSTINTISIEKQNEDILDVSEKVDHLNEHSSEVLDSNTVSSTASSKVPVSPLKPPAKILVPKPSPRLSDVPSRRISFQESDSEDEGKRKKPNLKCEVFKKKNGSFKENKEKTLQNNKRKRSQGSTYSKMGQDTLEKFSKKFGKDEAPDKTKLTMLDLIFYNPKSNPMTLTSQQTPTVRRKKEKSEINEAIEEVLEEQGVDDVEPAAIPVPQLKVGPDGQIMLDPQSLVIETTGTEKNRAKLENSQVIQESGTTRYSTYSKRKHERRDWTAQETLQFYKALNTIGSDFTLMASLFPKRSRHALKLKFKREERINLHLIDKAMTTPADFDFNALEKELKIENEEIERKKLMKKQAKEHAKNERAAKKKEKLMKKSQPRPKSDLKLRYSAMKDFDEAEAKSISRPFLIKGRRKKKRTRIMKSELTDSDLEEEMDLDSNPDVDMENIVEEDDLSLIKIIKETITGRVPKRTTKLEEYEEINETLKKKMEESESEEEGYVPNGLDAQMLFGSPLQAPIDDTNEGQWDIVIPSVPNIEETVLLNNVEEVSELSELGSFGQNEMALDLSMPVRPNVPELPSNLLSRHIISHSMQIIDQLTANVESGSQCREATGTVDESQEQMNDKVPLPSFESVSRSRPSVFYPLQPPFVTVECETQPQESVDGSNIEVDNYYNVTEEECILGE